MLENKVYLVHHLLVAQHPSILSQVRDVQARLELLHQVVYNDRVSANDVAAYFKVELVIHELDVLLVSISDVLLKRPFAKPVRLLVGTISELRQRVDWGNSLHFLEQHLHAVEHVVRVGYQTE